LLLGSQNVANLRGANAGTPQLTLLAARKTSFSPRLSHRTSIFRVGVPKCFAIGHYKLDNSQHEVNQVQTAGGKETGYKTSDAAHNYSLTFNTSNSLHPAYTTATIVKRLTAYAF
jgi:hypothetical protein